MIRDAAQVTGLSPSAWRLHPEIAKLARSLHIAIPPLDLIAEDAPLLPAFINWGDWKVMCDEPACLGKAEDIWRGWPYMLCMKCGNRSYGGRWRPVTMPEDVDAIEASLEELPRHRQHWHPTEPGMGAIATGGIIDAASAYVIGERDPHRMTIEQQNRARMATGGPISIGDAYIVDDEGPELFTAGASGTITPNQEEREG